MGSRVPRPVLRTFLAGLRIFGRNTVDSLAKDRYLAPPTNEVAVFEN
jgi:hypothetical protein